MNATNAFSLLKEMKAINPAQVQQHIKAAAQVQRIKATSAVAPADPTLLGQEDGDEYITGVSLKLPGTSVTIGVDVLVAFARKGMNIHFHGKKGSGKSRLIREVVKTLNLDTVSRNKEIFQENIIRWKKDGDKAQYESYLRLPYTPYVYSCHQETIADDLLVAPDVEYDEHGNRRTVLRYGAMLSAWSKELGGGLCILEEIDTPIPGRMIAAHALLDGQTRVWKSYVMGERTYTKHEDFVCLASSNTRGAGENIRNYAGTQIQNSALMSRFALSFEVDFLPYDVEHKFLTSKGVRKEIADKMLMVANRVRTSPSIEEGISIRDLRNWADAAQVWTACQKIDMAHTGAPALWTDVYRPCAVMTFVTRCADPSTRDAMLQFLNIV